MRKKVFRLLRLAWMVVIGMAVLTVPAIAVNMREGTWGTLPGDMCGWVVGLAVAFLILGSVMVVVVVHKRKKDETASIRRDEKNGAEGCHRRAL